MLATTSLTQLLVNLQCVTSKPNAGGGSEYRVTWKVVEAVHNFVHADKVTTNSSTDDQRCFLHVCFHVLRFSVLKAKPIPTH